MPLPAHITPYNYQIEMFHKIRDAFKTNQAVLAEGPTGSGKSIIMSLIVDSFLRVNKRWKLDRHLYFLIDEIFLMNQFSKHITEFGIIHETIGDGKKEGRAVNVHVATIQSLRRRPPKNEPAFFIVDEAHFSTSDSFMDLFEMYPDAKILGFTASPETGSGKGLAADWLRDENGIIVKDEKGKRINNGNGIFDILVESEVDMRQLTEGIEETDKSGYTRITRPLAPVKYYGVPITGIDNLHMRAGDYIDSEVEQLLKERGTYGDAIKEMEKFPDIKNHILVFCRNVKACYDMEIIFNSAGYSAEVLEGKLGRKDRKRVMSNFRKGETQILITCKMVQKGADIPDIRMAIDIQPTASRGTQRQKVGRTCRAAEGKEFAIFLDMVGNHRVFPNGDIYAKIEWNFNSKKYNKKPSGETQDRYCPVCYAFIPENATVCPECGAKKPEPKPKEEKHLDGELVKIEPVPLKEREPDEKRELQSKINILLHDENIAGLYEIGKELMPGPRVPFWIYYQITTKEKIVDIPLLYRIQRSLEYKPGWVYYAKQQLKDKGFAEEAS